MIINLTQHTANPEQIAQGVVDLPPDARQELQRLLTFDDVPTWDAIIGRAADIADLAYDAADNLGAPRPRTYMVGGAPFLMPALVRALSWNATVVAAFSCREVVEEPQPDGSVLKRSVFRHVGFAPVPFLGH